MQFAAFVCLVLLPLVLTSPPFGADNLLNQEDLLSREFSEENLYNNEDGLSDALVEEPEDFHDRQEAGTDLQRLAARELHTSKVSFPRSCEEVLTQGGGSLPSGEYTIYNPENYVSADQGFTLEPTDVYCQFDGEELEKRQMLSQVSSNVSHPRDCADIFMYHLSGDRSTRSGVYKVYNPKWYQLGPDGVQLIPIYVYCDMLTSGGGWTLFQRRQDGKVDFYQNWHDYEHGFGAVKREYWLGLRFINMIVSLRKNMLNIEMTTIKGAFSYATYNGFTVGDDSTSYKLTVGCYSGNDTYGDRLTYHTNYGFSTKDRGSAVSCAKSYNGAWWYRNCGVYSNLNGKYGHTSTAGIWWGKYSSTLNKKYVTMGFRPEHYR